MTTRQKLRALHKAYNKHQPQFVMPGWAYTKDVLGYCACGTFFYAICMDDDPSSLTSNWIRIPYIQANRWLNSIGVGLRPKEQAVVNAVKLRLLELRRGFRRQDAIDRQRNEP